MAEQAATLGGWLREKCQEEGLSLRGAATKTGLSHATIYEIIRGSPTSAQSIKKLAQSFSCNGHQRPVLEDKLLTLGGYRSERPEEKPISEPMARLLDKLGELNEPELKLIEQFADLISKKEEN